MYHGLESQWDLSLKKNFSLNEIIAEWHNLFCPNLIHIFGTMGDVMHEDLSCQMLGTGPPTYDSFMYFKKQS